MGSITFGMDVVAGSTRVPRPAAGMTAFLPVFINQYLQIYFLFSKGVLFLTALPRETVSGDVAFKLESSQEERDPTQAHVAGEQAERYDNVHAAACGVFCGKVGFRIADAFDLLHGADAVI